MDQVVSQYRAEADILRAQRSSEFENGQHYAATETAALRSLV